MSIEALTDSPSALDERRKKVACVLKHLATDSAANNELSGWECAGQQCEVALSSRSQEEKAQEGARTLGHLITACDLLPEVAPATTTDQADGYAE